MLFVVIAASEERAGLTHSVLGRRRFEGQARMYLVQPPAPLSSTPRAAHISEFHVHPPRQKGHAFPPSLGPRACVLSGCVALRACRDSKKLENRGVFCGTNFFKNLRASLGKGDAEANPPKTKDQRRGATLEDSEEEEEEEFIRIQRIL